MEDKYVFYRIFGVAFSVGGEGGIQCNPEEEVFLTETSASARC